MKTNTVEEIKEAATELVEVPRQKEVPKTFVVTEEDLNTAIERRDKLSWNYVSTEQCLVCTTMGNLGFVATACGWDCIDLNGKTHWMKNSRQLIRDFMDREYDKVRACLPFVIELK